MALYFFESGDEEKGQWQQAFPNQEIVCIKEPLVTPDQVLEFAEQVEVLSVFVQSKVTAEVMGAMPNLKCIVTRSTGFNHIDGAAAKARGVTVSNVPSYGENTVAEHAFGLLLAISSRTFDGIIRTREGRFSNEGLTGFDLKGKTVGVIGTGRIGKHFIQMAKGFNMRLLGFDLYPNESLTTELGLTYVSLEELLEQSDVVSLHAPSTPDTIHILNSESLQHAKPGMVLLNTARGDLVETVALVEALESGRIAAAGLDVLENEDEGLQEFLNHRLLAMPNVYITPHMAFNSVEGVARIKDATVENITAFLQGEAKNVVNS